jgi:hypothetical protein
MDATQRLNLPFIAPQQAMKHITHNEALQLLDALVQPVVLSRSVTAPPGTPAEGDGYIVPAGATGAWADREGDIALYYAGYWRFIAPAEGWTAYVRDSGDFVVFRAEHWTSFVSNGGSSIASFGINTDADDTNRLAVASAAVLFTHDGAGHQLKVNKASAGDTASLLFQTAYSGRAEMGLAGDDNWHLKVSADGANWHDALLANASTGALTAPATLAAPRFTANGAPGGGWTLDTTSAPITLAAGATLAFAPGSGLILVNDQSTTGSCALFLVGANSVVLLGQSSAGFIAGTPAAGQTGVFYNTATSSYAIKNNFTTSSTYGIAMIRTRMAT